MPLPMVHLAIAYNIVEAGFNTKNLPNFYLGAISPDAIHMRPNADRFAKNQTHLLQSNRNWEKINEYEHTNYIMDFVYKNKTESNIDFLWGYGIHILTDILWRKRVFSDFIVKYRKDENPVQEERWAYYNDTDRLDFFLFEESPWRENVWDKLQAANAMDFMDLLSAEEINAWNDRTLHWYDGLCQHKNPIRYITKSGILCFISESSKKILNDIYHLY